MHISRYTHLIGGNRIRHSLNKRIMTVSSNIYASLAGGNSNLDDGNTKASLVANGYLAPDSNSDNLQAEQIMRLQSSPAIQSLFLMIQTTCNLKCSYCFLGWDEAGTLLGPVKTMSTETAIKAVDEFAGLVANNPKPDGYWQAVTFYGGEPLLNLKVLTGTVTKIAEMRKAGSLWENTEIILNTNGVLVDEGFACFAADSHIEVQVSLDGFQPQHDRNRTDHHGHGSFDQAVAGIRRLISAGATVIPMITVNDQNMDSLTEFVSWMAADLGIREYMMNVLMSGTGDVSPDYARDAARVMWATYHNNLELGIRDSQYASQLAGFEPDSPIARPNCGANGRKLTVFPDGQVHTCQALNHSNVSYVGDLGGGFSTSHPTWANWSGRTRFHRAKCLSCPVLGSCDAGCAAGAYRATGSIHDLDPNHCRWLKETFRLWCDRI